MISSPLETVVRTDFAARGVTSQRAGMLRGRTTGCNDVAANNSCGEPVKDLPRIVNMRSRAMRVFNIPFAAPLFERLDELRVNSLDLVLERGWVDRT
jgi:hypothetical protein